MVTTISHDPHVRLKVRVVVFEQSEVVLGTFAMSRAQDLLALHIYNQLAL